MKITSGEGKVDTGLRWLRGVFAVFTFFVFLYFFIAEAVLPSERDFLAFQGIADYRNCSDFEADWYQVFPDGSEAVVDIPGECQGNPGETVSIETELPMELENNTYLCFRHVWQEVYVYVDGVLRVEYNTNETRPLGTETASSYIFVPLSLEDAGKNIRIDMRSGTVYAGFIKEMLIGEQYGIVCELILRHGLISAWEFVIVVLSAICILVCFVVSKIIHREIPLFYLSWACFFCALWMFSENEFRQFLFSNLTVFTYTTFWSLMLVSFPFTIYINMIQKRRYEKIYFPVGVLCTVNFVVSNLLHFLEIKDFWFLLRSTHITLVVMIASLMGTIFVDIAKKRVKEYWFIVCGILMLLLGSILEMVLYYIGGEYTLGMALALGLFMLLVMAIINTCQELLRVEKEKQKAVVAGESKARFLANMSHEIRTPINSIIGVNEMILRECREPGIRKYAMDIRGAVRTLHGMVNDILDMSKIESGKMDIHNAEYDLADLLYSIYSMMLIKARAKGLSMLLDVDKNLPVKIKGDDIKIRQILVNLLSNAVKYTKEGTVTLTVKGNVEEDKVELYFEVKDTGIGIKEEDLSKLAVAFERIEETRNRNIEGTGLGMNITINLLNMLGSVLDVKSVYGKGSVFSFRLQQEVVGFESIGEIEERMENADEEYDYQNDFYAPLAELLVVDDNDMNRMVFRNLLKATGVNVTEASSGMACLELIKKKHFDLIFMDHMMPEMDGIETLSHIKTQEENLCKTTPVIALTANAIAGSKEKYLAVGFDEFLTKPIMPKDLEEVVRKMLPQNLVQIQMKPAEGKTETKSEKKETKELPKVEGISWEYARLYSGSDEEIWKMVGEFYQRILSDADSLEEFSKDVESEEGLKQYRVKVHAMKSSAMLIGATFLGGAAKMMEDAARQGNRELVRVGTPSFLNEWRSYREKLKEFAELVQKKPVNDSGVILGILAALQNATENMDLDIMDESMDNLMQYMYPEEIQKKMEQLSDAVREIEQERVVELTGELLEIIRQQGCRG